MGSNQSRSAAAETSPSNPADMAQALAASKITITEFCRRESARGHRVESLGAFCQEETRAYRVKDTPHAYGQRLTAFLNRKVGERP